MPELPEIECLTRSLQQTILGKTLEKAHFDRHSLRWPIPISDIEKFIVHKEIISVSRISKYLLIGTELGYLIIHLGMSGNFFLLQQLEPSFPHTHARFVVRDHGSKKSYLHFVDPRRFGAILYCSKNQIKTFKLFRQLGPDPLSCKKLADHFMRLSINKKAPIKAFLMNSQNVVGIGNIYASEALHMAGISPITPTHEVTPQKWHFLETSIKNLLLEAINEGGTSFRDYKSLHGTLGGFKSRLRVYGRKGDPCYTCRTPVIEIRQTGRSTFYCPHCQL